MTFNTATKTFMQITKKDQFYIISLPKFYFIVETAETSQSFVFNMNYYFVLLLYSSQLRGACNLI